ncbi:NADP-dependent oxidoreductase [Alteribacter natronophilus]|uniref:NADP-dependent oxidoreductase n=1 Tax=Alteribacter natronophilus TaxID=2583810 RepID=UPI00110DB2F1|nr:NADP-dependent oxidoreductase [Alteribacter natronophilus]TMW71833.1 NADP-dependent oxidoreductase [Alteribacter natronophilus]
MDKQKRILLSKRPEGMPERNHFRIEEGPVPSLGENQVLVQTVYVSVDPYMRGRMEDTKSYVPPFKLGEVINGGIVGKVVSSRSTHFSAGDYVTGHLGWQEYNAADENNLRKIDPESAPLTAYLGALGMPGLTAYFGMTRIGSPQEGETVVVSGAAGAVGMIAGQIAKIRGAEVIGIAGTEEKTRYLTDTAGFDKALNYKTEENLHEALKDACPDGVDVYFDNTGGPVSEAVYPLMNDFGRIPQCGAISSYNKSGDDYGPRIHPYIVKSRLRLQGFIVSDYAREFESGARQLGSWLQEGKLVYEETVNEGFDSIPDAFLGLFEGKNLGKQLIKVSEE